MSERAYSPELCDAVLVPSGEKSHLFLIIRAPSHIYGYGGGPHVVLVNVSTIYDAVPYDAACVLKPGDHTFVRHPSFVAYRYARIDAVSHVAAMVASGSWVPHSTRCDEVIIERVVNGLCRSRLASRELKLLFRCPNALPPA